MSCPYQLPHDYVGARRALPLPSSLKYFARTNRPFRGNALLVRHLAANRITQFYRPLNDLQNSNVGFAAYFETADAVLPADSASSVDCAFRDNLIEAQTQRQKLGQHRR